jgi:competence protein ComEA
LHEQYRYFIEKGEQMKKMHLMIVMMLSLVLTLSVSTAFSATKDIPVTTPAVPAAVPAVPTAAITDKININTADEAALVKIKGVGKKKAEAIVAYRKDHGNFASVEDLRKIKGFGPKVFEKIKPFITI